MDKWRVEFIRKAVKNIGPLYSKIKITRKKSVMIFLRLMMRKNGCADDPKAWPVKLARQESMPAKGFESTLGEPIPSHIAATITGQNAEKMPKF